MSGIKDILASRKAILTLVGLMTLGLLVWYDKVDWSRAQWTVGAVIVAYLLSQGVADAAERFGSHAADAHQEQNSQVWQGIAHGFLGAINTLHPPPPIKGDEHLKIKLEAILASLNDAQILKVAETGIFSAEQILAFKDLALEVMGKTEKEAVVTPPPKSVDDHQAERPS